VLTRIPQDRLVWGWVRLFLGFAQIALVGMGAGALFTVGLKPITLILVIAATSLSVISRVIYRGCRSQNATKLTDDR
jgi:hypothetical protein